MNALKERTKYCSPSPFIRVSFTHLETCDLVSACFQSPIFRHSGDVKIEVISSVLLLLQGVSRATLSQYGVDLISVYDV